MRPRLRAHVPRHEQSGIQADGEPGGDAAQQLGLAAEPAEPAPAQCRPDGRGQPRPGDDQRLVRPRAGRAPLRVIDPSGQVGGWDHDMGAAAAGTASASQPHPRPAPIPAANGPWAGASPAAQPTTAPASQRARRKTPLRGRLVERADHLWLTSRPSTLPDSGSSVHGAAGVALCRRHRVIAIRPTRQRISADPRPHLRVGDRRST